jgi:hypothetical protein
VSVQALTREVETPSERRRRIRGPDDTFALRFAFAVLIGFVLPMVSLYGGGL